MWSTGLAPLLLFSCGGCRTASSNLLADLCSCSAGDLTALTALATPAVLSPSIVLLAARVVPSEPHLLGLPVALRRFDYCSTSWPWRCVLSTSSASGQTHSSLAHWTLAVPSVAATLQVPFSLRTSALLFHLSETLFPPHFAHIPAPHPRGSASSLPALHPKCRTLVVSFAVLCLPMLASVVLPVTPPPQNALRKGRPGVSCPPFHPQHPAQCLVHSALPADACGMNE